MKEIILNSIESKMCKISRKNIDVADFETWIDKILEDKVTNISHTVDAETDCQGVFLILDKSMKETNGNYDSRNVTDVDKWLCEEKEIKNKLQHRVSELENLVGQIESSVGAFGEGNQHCKILNFQEWLRNLQNFCDEKDLVHDTESKNMLLKIQNEIREFDDEDENFEISSFPDWIEKIQSRMDDLEVELLNEQETRENEEQQRIAERSKLEELFNEKQNEISLLKVELYNKSTLGHAVDPESSIIIEQESNITLQEQLNEANARCEALQNELLSSQRQNSDGIALQNQLNDLSSHYASLQNQQHESKNEKMLLQNHLTEAETKCEMIQSECFRWQNEVSETKEALDKVTSDYKLMFNDCNDFTNIMKVCESYMPSIMNKQPIMLDESTIKDNTKVLNFFNIFKDFTQTYQHLQQQSKNIANEMEEWKDKYHVQEAKATTEKSTIDILLYIGSSLDTICALETNLIIDNQLCSIDLDYYIAYMEGLKKFVNGLTEANNLLQSRIHDSEQQIVDINNARTTLENEFDIVEKEKFDLLQTVNQQNDALNSTKGNIVDHNAIEELKMQHITKVKQLQEELDETKKSMELREAAEEGHGKEIEELRLNVADLEKIVEELRSSANIQTTGGGMKFGALKRKLQELEAFTETLRKENEELKVGQSKNTSVPLNTTPVQETFQIMLAEKTEQCLYYQQECEQLKTRLFEVQNDTEMLREEFQKLKTTLVEQQTEISMQETYQASLGSQYQNQVADSIINQHHQDQLHNLSLMLTEKSEESLHLQQECDHLKARLVEIENETSDMELIREECKQLKAMLVGKEHQNRVDETISMLQEQCKRLKYLLAVKDTELQQMQKTNVEKDNDLSDMELLREECKQLKQMLMNKAHPQQQASGMDDRYYQLEVTLQEMAEEIRQKNATIIDMRNSNSDMELLREECKQLKLMLINKDQHQGSGSRFSDSLSNSNYQQLENILQEKESEIQQKNASITDLQNSTADMELLCQQCSQLKLMLTEKGQSMNLNTSVVNMSMGDYQQNSFLLQVQQLEEFLKEKDDEIQEKENKIRQRDVMIVELQNAASNMELLHNERQALMEMLVEKERMFTELQGDVDSANSMIQQKNHEIKLQSHTYTEIEKQLQEALNLVNTKDRDNEALKEELTESMAQEENIHLLQTEYRNVEEHLNSVEKELIVTQESLFTAETHCERLKVYEEQYEGLKETLKHKEEELSNLRLQSSESSILESETVQLLHQELNELKAIVYERENQIIEQNNTLEKTNIELQNIYITYSNCKETIESLNSTIRDSHSRIDQLNIEKSSLDKLCFEKESKLQTFINNEQQLMDEVQNTRNEINSVNQTKADSENLLTEHALKLYEAEKRVQELESQLHEEQIKSAEIAHLLRENATVIGEGENKIEDLESQVLLLELKHSDNERKVKEYLIYIQENETKVQNLELQLRQANKKHQKLIESMQYPQVNNDETKNSKTCDTCEGFLSERKVLDSIVGNIKKLLQFSENEEHGNALVQDITAIENSVQSLLTHLREKDKNVEDLKIVYEKLQVEYDAKMNENSTKISTLEEKMEEKQVHKEKLSVEYDFKIKDLQSQLLEYKELEVMYQNKVSECERLQDQLIRLQEENYQSLQDVESNVSAHIAMECEQLRKDLQQNSHSFLEKNKECDQLKLDVFHLEEKAYNLQLSLDKMKHLEEEVNKMQDLRKLCASKDTEVENLTSLLEDHQALLESGNKEKAFLEELTLGKEKLEKEKEDLSFQKNQMALRLQEQDVLLKHKDVEYREIEAKASRELDRLRNHLMMIEENHTKGFLECQQREDGLQQELDEAKQVLSKKSIILQDSSKQFQEHVVDLEEQLHVLAAQRDSQALDLAKSKERIEHDSAAIYNLQSALEQLQKDKTEQYDYLTSLSKRKQSELEARLQELIEEQQRAQATMAEASLAVQGINKLNLELQQKENELKVSKEKINELAVLLQERDFECNKMLEASDNKLDKSLIRNLLLKYFQSPEDKRGDIVQVIGGLMGLSQDEIRQIGSGAAQSKVSGWISNVWGFATPKKTDAAPPPPQTPVIDTDKSFSELFVKFLENETETRTAVNTTSLTYANETATPNVRMFSPSTPDILAFHNKRNELGSGQRIPAPGQEIPRVHTHHAQSTLKDLLS